MLKKKLLPILVAAFVITAIAVFGMGHSVSANADEPDGISVQTASADCFVYSDSETDKTIIGFNAPAGDGYFEVVIPADVKRIASGSFVGGETNSALSERFVAIQIPSDVAIEQNAFVECKNLVEVCALDPALESKVGDSGLYDNAISRVFAVADKSLHVCTDGADKYLFVRNGRADSTAWTLFAYGGNATELTLPAATVCDSKCTSYDIYQSAFAFRPFTSVTVPECVTAIGSRAFTNCTELGVLNLAEGLETIGSQAFYNAKISSLTVPATVATVRENAFNNCAYLTELKFAERTGKLMIYHYAFGNCGELRKIDLPAKTEVRQYAFSGCQKLAWVYVGKDVVFKNTAEGDSGDPDAIFFPTNTNLSIVYESKSEYDKMLADSEITFRNNNGDAATYVVDVNCYVGDSSEPITYKRLHGEKFNYVCDENTGFWNTDTAYSALPAQAAHYASTVWYAQRELTEDVSWEDVNELLAGSASAIDLYCYETIEEPIFPAEPATWVYDSKTSYDIADLSQVLKALGCTNEFTEKQLGALTFEVVYADSDGKVKSLPSSINGNGVYSVTVSLNEKYGSWTKPAASTVTINVDTSPFNKVLIALIVIGCLAVLVTVSTAIIRKKVLTGRKRKQISREEALERYRAAGGETNLK